MGSGVVVPSIGVDTDDPDAPPFFDLARDSVSVFAIFCIFEFGRVPRGAICVKTPRPGILRFGRSLYEGTGSGSGGSIHLSNVLCCF